MSRRWCSRGGGDEVADRREHDGRRLAAGQQMEEDGNRRGREPDQRPRVKKTDHAARGDGARPRGSTMPKGVSVVTRW